MNSFSKSPSIGEEMTVKGEVSMGIIIMDIKGLVEVTTREVEEVTILEEGSP